MQYPALLFSDPHFVASSSCEYRWGLWPWLVEQCKIERVKTLLCLGDLTDAKDNHSAELVNRIVKSVASIPKEVDFKILSGNHDWLRAGQEFFRFLNMLPNVEFITEPREDQDVKGIATMYLPYSKQPAKDWAGFDLSHYTHVFMHQTIKGSRSSNGQEMEGEDLPDLSAAGKIYSGDIHVPQSIGPIEYVGSPYHVHFGDRFTPRCVLLERDGKAVNLYFKTIERFILTVPDLGQLDRELDGMRKGDQVKLRVKLAESEKHEWSRIRREAAALIAGAGVECHGIELLVEASGRRLLNEATRRQYDPSDAVERFVMAEELGGEALDVGLRLIGGK